MAHLGSRTTSGQLAWEKYVSQNKNWRDLKLVTEDKAQLFKKVGIKLHPITSLEKGQPLGLKSNQAFHIDGKKYAQVQLDKRTEGFLVITAIRKPTNFKPTGYETQVVDMINKHIAQNSNMPIDLKIAGDNTLYKGIKGAIQVDTNIKRAAGVSADPKADIILFRDKNNLLAPHNIFVSHKKEGGPEAFQQYGGLSRAAGEEIFNHPETRKFLREVTKNIKDGKLQNPMFMGIRSMDLKNKSIFGPDYGRKYGLQHTQIIGQGLPKLIPTRRDNVYELDFTSHMSRSGDLSHFTGGYLPVFGATYREGRGFEFEGNRYDGARVGIYPHKLVATRGGVIEVK